MLGVGIKGEHRFGVVGVSGSSGASGGSPLGVTVDVVVVALV
jgi:hypothetical protein